MDIVFIVLGMAVLFIIIMHLDDRRASPRPRYRAKVCRFAAQVQKRNCLGVYCLVTSCPVYKSGGMAAALATARKEAEELNKIDGPYASTA